LEFAQGLARKDASERASHKLVCSEDLKEGRSARAAPLKGNGTGGPLKRLAKTERGLRKKSRK
jgi:hypothetical protein